MLIKLFTSIFLLQLWIIQTDDESKEKISSLISKKQDLKLYLYPNKNESCTYKSTDKVSNNFLETNKKPPTTGKTYANRFFLAGEVLRSKNMKPLVLNRNAFYENRKNMDQQELEQNTFLDQKGSHIDKATDIDPDTLSNSLDATEYFKNSSLDDDRKHSIKTINSFKELNEQTKFNSQGKKNVLESNRKMILIITFITIILIVLLLTNIFIIIFVLKKTNTKKQSVK